MINLYYFKGENMNKKICIVCGIEMKNCRSDKKTCSPNCNTKYLTRKKKNRPISNIDFYNDLKIKCVVCGKEIQGQLITKKTCSRPCTDKYNQRKEYGLPFSDVEYNKLLNKTCEWCGKEYLAGHAFSKTCSNKCATAIYRKTKRKPIINKWTSEKRKTDLSYKIIGNIRSRLYHAIIRGGNLKHETTLKLTGCSKEDLIKHLETTAHDGFSWNDFTCDNYAIDHIIPCHIYNMSIHEDQKKCFNYKNLRIITKLDNLKKANKIDFDLIEKYNIKHLLPEGYNIQAGVKC
jgi:predicted nucleic acid-binding Zn ribbon protein